MTSPPSIGCQPQPKGARCPPRAAWRYGQWLWLVSIGATLWPLATGAAHPLGAASVDHYSQVEITPGKVIVVYDVDLAEVATFQAMKTLDAPGHGTPDAAAMQAYAATRARQEAAHLHLEVNGHPLPLAPATARMFLIPGQGTLPTMRLIATLETAPGTLAAALRGAGAQAGAYRDDNEPDRVGWREISVQGIGTEVIDRSIDGHPAAVSPQGYAMDNSGNQSEVREVGFHFQGLAAGAAQPSPVARQAIEPRRRDADPFARLLTAEHLTPMKMWWLILVAAGLGGFHALSPGHGKTLVAAYLVGSRGTAWHAVILGLIVTFTHTAGVFALGLVTLFASRYLLPDTLYPWLTAASGLVIAQIGLLRLFGRGGFHQHEHEDGHEHGAAHTHTHSHSHAGAGEHPHVHPPGQESHLHAHTHSHGEVEPTHPGLPQHGHSHGDGGHEHEHEHHHLHEHGHHHHLPAAGEPITWRSLTALGVSGGLVPCPSALVVLLSAVALHQIGFGLALIVAFSAGLAIVLTGIGIVMVYARDFLGSRLRLSGWFLALVPKLGAALIFVIGVAIAMPAVILLARRY